MKSIRLNHYSTQGFSLKFLDSRSDKNSGQSFLSSMIFNLKGSRYLCCYVLRHYVQVPVHLPYHQLGGGVSRESHSGLEC